MKSGKIVLGALAGLAIGTIMGILFAPDSGAKTRKKLLRKGEDCVDMLKDKVEEYVETIKDKYQDIKKEAETVVSNKSPL